MSWSELSFCVQVYLLCSSCSFTSVIKLCVLPVYPVHGLLHGTSCMVHRGTTAWYPLSLHLCLEGWGNKRSKRKMNMSKWGREPIFMQMSVLPGHSHLVYSATVFQLYFEKACPLWEQGIALLLSQISFPSPAPNCLFPCSGEVLPYSLALFSSSLFSTFCFSFLFLFFPFILNYLWLYLFFFLNLSFLINFSFLSSHLSNILIYFPSLILVVSPHPLWLMSWMK